MIRLLSSKKYQQMAEFLEVDNLYGTIIVVAVATEIWAIFVAISLVGHKTITLIHIVPIVVFPLVV